MSFNDGQWGQSLRDRLQGNVDVVNRGFGGYTSRLCLAMLPELFPETFNFDDVACLTILLGTNDCIKHEAHLSVTTAEYMTNMAAIIQFFVDRGLTKDRIILITPPPFYTDKFNRWLEMTMPELFVGGDTSHRTFNNRSIEYAEACLEVGSVTQVNTLNLNQIFTRDPRGDYLVTDGIHFSIEGSQLLFSNLWPMMKPKIVKHIGTDQWIA
ncbi:Isoamyl acetate-hydrolyzing esterase 1 -like protein [Halotydeus destructor]|nr:Isoamyl acetate-hydrolyzing esterase 1 -like protein [Halotydeus destructor]